MTGVVIGTGNWVHVAQVAADRMAEMTGLKCYVVADEFCPVYHPSWLKTRLIEHFPHWDSFLVFDADMICLRHWNPELIFESLGRPFCVVPDRRVKKVYEECEELGISFPDVYVNAGLMMFGAEHKSILDSAWSKHPRCGRFLEQGALNLALLETDMQVCRLPRRFNHVCYWKETTKAALDDSGVVNIHTVGLSSCVEVREAHEKFGLTRQETCLV